MNPFASYEAINAKLHAKKRTLLSETEWHKVAECQNVNQVVEFLKKRDGYKELMTQYKADEFHRSDIEVILDRYCVSEIEEMLHYFSGEYKDFFKTFLMEYEINDLELILRSIVSNDDMKELEKVFTHSEKWAMANYQKLLTCKNIQQFIEALKGTSYYNVLKTMTQEDLSKREFHMEMKLYMLFYSELINKASKLKAKDEKIARKFIGTKIDFLNAQWIYRALKYYDISSEEILIYSLSNGNKINYHKLKGLSYSRNVDEFKKLTEKYLGYQLFKYKDDVFLDCHTDRYLYMFSKRMKQDNKSIASSIAYLYTLGIEVNDLVALTEGIRYTLPEAELSKYLVHTI